MNGVGMTRFDRRVKIVSFRLSEREHRDSEGVLRVFTAFATCLT